MVNLSLQHRVKFEKQATLLSETSHDGPHTALLGLAAAIAVLNVLFLVNGAVIAAIIDWTWYRETGLSHQSWYKDDSIDVERTKLLFLYCTIPLILSAVSVFTAIQHRRSTPSGLFIAIGSAISGSALWIVQFGMQGKCVLEHSLGVASPHEPPPFCAYSFRDTWDPKSFWQTGLAVAYYATLLSISMLVLYFVYLALAIVLLVKQRRTADKPSKVPQAYAYHSAVEETEMQTDRDMPDRSAAPTPVPQDASSRLPSYPAASAFDEHLAPEKERDMV
ncbi:hypothetical protein LTR91_000306 [Friedmanniomyces endolithicus]|uniref:Uncharacterized protein n=1 Tax=Friedmanniomyces endolithicus TaxID=329885 RepID=A0AAN6FFA7_9PEZI|nr:hypothetical protein LTR35_010144 [Friedmanniomyces endolithicus]KAK0298363.1 hypothetical protein LTS00_003328 [Friedmanniomyces endolithicus]KAK0317382.1 hypothetical protein LTR82_011705 [Friedmanniomyces endolithicus]KAK0931356.1 hypothetical protein LTR57_000771 [Friedmanniomyces endolithicus]KAK1010850.1 hypothetical protein LTS01_001542 [Friedmanniomyces endolithicus]